MATADGGEPEVKLCLEHDIKPTCGQKSGLRRKHQQRQSSTLSTVPSPRWPRPFASASGGSRAHSALPPAASDLSPEMAEPLRYLYVSLASASGNGRARPALAPPPPGPAGAGPPPAECGRGSLQDGGRAGRAHQHRVGVREAGAGGGAGWQRDLPPAALHVPEPGAPGAAHRLQPGLRLRGGRAGLGRPRLGRAG